MNKKSCEPFGITALGVNARDGGLIAHIRLKRG